MSKFQVADTGTQGKMKSPGTIDDEAIHNIMQF